MLTEKAAMYSTLGISKEVFAFGTKIEEELKERFAKIDEIAEYNQLKVIHAMQASKVSEACLYGTTGYGYNDLGRDTLEQVYATCFGTEDALVRPQIACGTHALATALSGNLRPGDELLVCGPTTGAVFVRPEGLRVDDAEAAEAVKGDDVTFRVPEKIRENDRLYVMRETVEDELA